MSAGFDLSVTPFGANTCIRSFFFCDREEFFQSVDDIPESLPHLENWMGLIFFIRRLRIR